MKDVEISYEETVQRINTVTISVPDDTNMENMVENIYNQLNNASHPDDVMAAVAKYGTIIATCTGAEECEYELQNIEHNKNN